MAIHSIPLYFFFLPRVRFVHSQALLARFLGITGDGVMEGGRSRHAGMPRKDPDQYLPERAEGRWVGTSDDG